MNTNLEDFFAEEIKEISSPIVIKPRTKEDINPTDTITLNELTYDYSKNDVQLRRQVTKEIISNTGIWADVAFLYQEFDVVSDDWKSPKVTVARFKKTGGVWKKQNHLNINSIQRADQIIAVLLKWRDQIGN